MKCSLGISSFLEEISSLYCSIVFLYFFALIAEEGFLISPAILSSSAFRWIHLSFSLLPFTFLLFSAIFKASSDNHFAFLHFFFLGMVFITSSCTVLWTSVHRSSGTLIHQIKSLESICHFHCIIVRIWFRSYLNDLVVFPTFFNLSLNFPTMSSWSEPQSAPTVSSMLTAYSFSIFGCKEYHQSDFGVDHLVMSMCRVISCAVGRGCLLWPVCSLGRTVSLCPASFCTPKPTLPVTPDISWLPTFAFQSPMMQRTSFFFWC